jgi:hypothetical protein
MAMREKGALEISRSSIKPVRNSIEANAIVATGTVPLAEHICRICEMLSSST